jgi:DNA-binding MarR family transcriptional regulator
MMTPQMTKAASPGEPPLDQLLYAVVRQIRPLHRHLVSAVEDNLEGTDVSVPLRGLLEILHEKGPLTPPQAARSMAVGRQFGLRVVDRAIELGLAEARPNPDHRRSALIALTASGTRHIEAIRKSEQRVIRRVVGPLARVDVERCLAVITYLTQAYATIAGDRSAVGGARDALRR